VLPKRFSSSMAAIPVWASELPTRPKRAAVLKRIPPSMLRTGTRHR
jgi:hypothetical protein